MNTLRIVVTTLLLLCFTAQFDVAHEHHCLVEKAACGTCRIAVAPFAATPPLATALHVAHHAAHVTHAPADAQHPCNLLRDAFRLRAPPQA